MQLRSVPSRRDRGILCKEGSRPRQRATKEELVKHNSTCHVLKVSETPCPHGCTPVRVFVTVEQFSEILRLRIDLSDLIQNWLDDDIAVYQHDEEDRVSCCGCHHNSVINYEITGEWKPYCDHPAVAREIPPSRNNDAPEWCPYRKNHGGKA